MVQLCFFFFKQKTAYEMRISDWSSDVCSSDLEQGDRVAGQQHNEVGLVCLDQVELAGENTIITGDGAPRRRETHRTGSRHDSRGNVGHRARSKMRAKRRAQNADRYERAAEFDGGQGLLERA